MRAAIFVDGAYLLKQFQEARISPDYSKLAQHLLEPLRRAVQLDLLRCYFYDCSPWMSANPTDEERRRMAAHERFVAELEDIERWQVRLGKLERRRDGDKEVFAQKRVDVQLSVDLVRHAAAGHIQHAVLVAGDSDFIPAVVAAKESGATLTLWCGKDRSPHKDLMLAADEVQFLDWKMFPQRKVTARASGASAGRGRGRSAVGLVVAPSEPFEPAVIVTSAAPAVSGGPSVVSEALSGQDETTAPLMGAENVEGLAGGEAGQGSNGEKKRRRGRRGGRGRRRNGERDQTAGAVDAAQGAPVGGNDPASKSVDQSTEAVILSAEKDLELPEILRFAQDGERRNSELVERLSVADGGVAASAPSQTRGVDHASARPSHDSAKPSDASAKAGRGRGRGRRGKKGPRDEGATLPLATHVESPVESPKPRDTRPVTAKRREPVVAAATEASAVVAAKSDRRRAPRRRKANDKAPTTPES